MRSSGWHWKQTNFCPCQNCPSITPRKWYVSPSSTKEFIPYVCSNAVSKAFGLFFSNRYYQTSWLVRRAEDSRMYLAQAIAGFNTIRGPFIHHWCNKTCQTSFRGILERLPTHGWRTKDPWIYGDWEQVCSLGLQEWWIRLKNRTSGRKRPTQQRRKLNLARSEPKRLMEMYYCKCRVSASGIWRRQNGWI